MSGEASRKNGKKGGRPRGSKSTTTIMKELELAEFQRLARERMEAIFYSQLNLALGTTHLYRIDEGPKGGKEHKLVTDPDEIGDVLSQLHNVSDSGVINDQYYYITTAKPDNAALNSIEDRAYGKATQALEMSGPKGAPIEVSNPQLEEAIAAATADILKKQKT